MNKSNETNNTRQGLARQMVSRLFGKFMKHNLLQVPDELVVPNASGAGERTPSTTIVLARDPATLHRQVLGAPEQGWHPQGPAAEAGQRQTPQN